MGLAGAGKGRQNRRFANLRAGLKVKANGIEIEYEIHGEGEPLVLISGLGYSRWCWHRMVPELSKKFQVITFDNRGMGGTDRTAGPYTAELLAEDTAALLDALKVRKAHIVGLSMGGFVAQALALARPELFKSLTLISTGFGGKNQIPARPEDMALLFDLKLDLKGRLLLACAPGFENRQPDFFQQWMQERQSNPPHPEGYKSQLAIGLKLLDPDCSFEKGLRKLKIPSLILFGEWDRVIPSANGALLQKALSGSELVVFPQTGHFLPFEIPRLVADEILRFCFKTSLADSDD